jgi:hypothetical protein
MFALLAGNALSPRSVSPRTHPRRHPHPPAPASLHPPSPLKHPPPPPAQRTVYSVSSNVDDTISEIEDMLLQSPLVTSAGNIIVVADNMTMFLLPDPATLAAGARWAPVAQFTPTQYVTQEAEFAGLAIDTTVTPNIA